MQARREWTTPAEIVEAAVAHDSALVASHDVRIEAEDDRSVEVDPRLTSSALAHLIENAVRYAGLGTIVVRGWTDEQGLRLEVRDEGPGLKERELQRLRSHLGMARGLFEDGAPAGKRLDFLGQEMMREANTIGSKAATAQVVEGVVDLKSEIERLREQVQNVE